MTAPNADPSRAAEASDTAYAVKLGVFEGPLDLLLHLIRTNEVEITDIPVAQIAAQYVEYIDLMRDLNLDVAGEYLVMSATLAWIKSRMLLPVESEGDEEDGLDPRAELVARLLEYQRFKEVAVAANAPEPEKTPDAEREIEVDLFKLVEAFRDALKRAGPSGAAHEIEAEIVTVQDRMKVVMDTFGERDRCEFEEFLREGDQWASRPVIVATFLAILELTRLEALGIFQGIDEFNVPVGPIHLRRRIAAGDTQWMDGISDLM
jgi:segregation and condensation protein A